MMVNSFALCFTLFAVTCTLQEVEKLKKSSELNAEDEDYVEKSDDANKEIRRSVRDERGRMLQQGDTNMLGTFDTRPSMLGFTDEGAEEEDPATRNIGLHSSKQSAYVNKAMAFNDPLWKYQWFMQDYRTSAGPVMDHNIVPAQYMGYTGRGVKLAIVGEGVLDNSLDMNGQYDHNYFYDAVEGVRRSADLQRPKLHADLLFPVMSSKMAAVIAMRANNSLCGAGIAYDAKVSAIKVSTFGEYNSMLFAAGIARMTQHFDIFVDAIDRTDDGRGFLFSQPVRKAIQKIANKGRDSKGSIFVTGTGDGKRHQDYCGADDIVNNVHAFVIASADQLGRVTSYGEKCPGVLATAYSSHDRDQQPGETYEQIVAIDEDGHCSACFGGNHASIAIASGIIALTLQANLKMTWRDVMHVIVMSSEMAPLANNRGWKMNQAGFYVSHNFGFGLFNAENMVLAAKDWVNVPQMSTCRMMFAVEKRRSKLRAGHTLTFETASQDCVPVLGFSSKLRYVEQVELITTLTYTYRGALTIKLASPKKSDGSIPTESRMLHERLADSSFDGLKEWSIKSLQFWGENPTGTWKLTIGPTKKIYLADTISTLINGLIEVSIRGNYVRKAELVIHGTSTQPHHYKGKPENHLRTYSYAMPAKY